ncbi:MAG: hypothetical protein SRB2_02153 [Desulfobacteraceae bacterium Eth-SRB2]|nr:MAG: hypothetical protein SRB2_02153 [Desulfobacteraceae bacterium Eth-SRB2]
MPENKINPRWLNLKEAARYSGIGKERLKKLADESHIKGFQDPDDKRGKWIFDRYSLDQYRENQAGRIRQKALKILKRHHTDLFKE